MLTLEARGSVGDQSFGRNSPQVWTHFWSMKTKRQLRVFSEALSEALRQLGVVQRLFLRFCDLSSSVCSSLPLVTARVSDSAAGCLAADPLSSSSEGQLSCPGASYNGVKDHDGLGLFGAFL